MAQMGMVMHAPKAKNDRIIDLFLVLDPKTVPRKIWAVSKDMGPGYGGLRCPLTSWGLVLPSRATTYLKGTLQLVRTAENELSKDGQW